MKNITPSEFDELRKRIFFELLIAKVNVTREGVIVRMLHYEEVFSGGLADMLAFIKWADKNGEDQRNIAITIAHDLGGVDDICFLPRTDGYYKEVVNE